MKHKNRNGIEVEDVESLGLLTSPESNSRCLIVQIELQIQTFSEFSVLP